MNNLTGDLISLRMFDLSDVRAHLEGEDAEISRWVSGGKSTPESVENWIKENKKEWDNNGPRFTFAIVENKTKNLTGFIEANHDFEKVEQIKEGEVNISYGIYPQYRGKGYAVEAIRLVMEFLRSRGTKKAVLAIDPENANSLKIPEFLGFEKTGEIVIQKNQPLIIFSKSL